MTGNDNWDRHWTAYASSATLNPAQAYRRMLLLDWLALDRAPRPVRLLELGSGQGDFAQDLGALGCEVEFVGLDVSEVGVEVARRKCPKARFFQRDLTRPLDLPEELRSWATHAVCSELLEHVDDPALLLGHALPYLAAGCELVITVPGGPISAFDRHIGHRAHFTVERLTRTLKEAGFEVGSVRGAGFPFFNLYRLTVLARGRALIQDVDMTQRARLGTAATLALRTFGYLFRHNRADSRFGWQLIARAIKPTEPTDRP